ncbi:riboflavin biosynthesis pyrimidine reductase [Thiogranum longum]|uniref:Riboflavin biosynthesis pyrimidine reductase n=1 Tax=Thiogranum longum TaxID=1537524 RepID=A0A4V2PH34_9GAMM|nr:dihydrofolate reductase family protein [Thiogranum longum]TCK19176.1 riboflavin biosynthesis pyrimidine reductase [Thiogranum longum]
MNNDILELYPDSGKTRSLRGLYLGQIPATTDQPFIYTNYIASIDGRIALPATDRRSSQVPPAIANSRDWRLFQELAAQADLLISSARYFRQAVEQEAQAELPVGRAHEFDDLRDWRLEQGLSPQPDIAVFSASLDIPVEALRAYAERKIYIITGGDADPKQVDSLARENNVQVIQCGDARHVDATELKSTLGKLGYQRIYAIAGPSVLHALVHGNALDRLYLTTAHCLLGGEKFDTIARGPEFSPACKLPLRAMYLDPHMPEGAGQTLAVYGR